MSVSPEILMVRSPSAGIGELRRAIAGHLYSFRGMLVRPEQIDANGHLNNVAYLQEAEQYVTGEYTALDVAFDRECFAGEKLSLVGSEDGETKFVCIRKENGDLSFSARFGKEKAE